MLREATILVKVSSLTVDPFTALPVVVLVDEPGETAIPISVGIAEASAIATELDRIELERPMTHQLVAAMLAKMGAVIEAVEVHDLIGDTFYASIRVLLASGESLVQDARPSDALALALHTGAAIGVAARVIDKLRRPCTRRPPRAARSRSKVDTGDGLEALGDDAFGKWKV